MAEEIDAKREAYLKELEEKVKELEAENTLLLGKKEDLENEKIQRNKEFFGWRFDELTGLNKRDSYFSGLDDEILRIINNPKISGIVEADEVLESDMRFLNDVPLTAASADLGYLQKYNKDRQIHNAMKTVRPDDGGDLILTKTAALIQITDKENLKVEHKLRETEGFRIGGDEFAFTIKLRSHEADEVIDNLKEEHAKIEIPGSDLPPSIDIGTAHVSEAIRAFVKAVPKEKRKEMSPDEKAKKIQKFLTGIASRRESLQRGMNRIKFMVHLDQEKPEILERNYQYLLKGALGMEKDKIKELASLQKQNPADFDVEVNRLVWDDLDIKRKEQRDAEQIEFEVLREIANSKFFLKNL